MLTKAMLCLIAALVAFAGLQTWRLHDTQAENATLQASITVLADKLDAADGANKAESAARRKAQAMLEEAVGQAQVTDKMLRDAVARQAAAEKGRRAALAEARAAKEKLYAQDPSYLAWAVQPVHPVAGQRLRQLWSAASPDLAGGSGAAAPAAGAGVVRADAPGTAAAAAATGPDLPDPLDVWCYSLDQYDDALTTALSALTTANGRLAAIEQLSIDAATPVAAGR